MDSLLSTIKAGGVILPHDLVPDYHPVFYTEVNGNAIPSHEELCQHDLGEGLATEIGNRDRCIALAIGYYNHKNGSDYMICDAPDPIPHPLECTYYNKDDHFSYFHCVFYAAPSTNVSAFKLFYCDFHKHTDQVARCDVIHGLDRCDRCGFYILDPAALESLPNRVVGWYNSSVTGMDLGSYKWDKLPMLNPIVSMLQKERMKSFSCVVGYDTSNIVSTPPFYSGDLATGVSLSDKAKLRLEFVLPPLAYYNKKQHTNYKLVDALPYCTSFAPSFQVAHGNFIAREGDGPNKLFFAEHENSHGVWVVVGCRIVHGKTSAGCLRCTKSKWARQVIHPTRGFRHGLFRRGGKLGLRPRKSARH